MKKILAILLVLAMVLPMCIAVGAEETSDVGIKPFYMLNYDREVEDGFDFDNIYPKIFFWSRASDDYVTEDSIKVSVPGVGGSTPKAVAENLKKIYDEFPEGARYLRFGAVGAALRQLLEDQVFMEKGAEVMKKWFDEFIEHYYNIGGKLDGVITDIEYFEISSYYIDQEAKKDMYIYHKIVSNPMYEVKIRPELVERGFKFWPNPTEETPEIYSISPTSGSEYAQSRNIWNVVLRNHINKYVDDALMDSLLKYYPNAILSDYQSRNTYAWHKNLTDTGGVTSGGNHKTVGNASYFNTYSARPGTGFFKDGGVPIYKNIPSYNGTVWKDNPFNMVLWDAIHYKNYYLAAPDNKTTAIIVYYNYNTRAGGYCGTPYYSEMIYHVGMMDPEPFQGYCMVNEMKASGADPEYAMQIISELLSELTRIVGAADRKPIIVPYSWNDKYVLSGMYAGGKNYWRITPDTTGGMTLEKFKVADAKDPTFSIDGKTVTFPGGKIIEDAKITEVGTCGYWVETAKDVLPVITSIENRFSEYPAFVETYETYEAGSNFDIAAAFPTGCWEVKKDKSGSAKIVDASGSKALALSGNYSLKLKEILGNITAGDTYAENQAWEVDVTVPANMGAEAEIVLFDIYGTKAKPEVGGIKIAGGKVYYDNAGNYEEMAGVDVSAGGKFKVQRSVDFNNAEAFTSDYTIYDASGKVLGQVKDVPMPTVKLPIEKISLTVSKITGDAVLMDNFKLYANGVGADFEVYDFDTGIKQTDLDKARDRDTAYRFSWMNGTAYEKVYSIVAAYYNGDKLVEEKVIKEIKMAPGTDAVDTGIVKLEDGQSVRLFARNDSKPEPEGGIDNTGSDKPGKTGSSEDTVLLIAIIAVAVVLVAIIVVAVVFLTKKPAAEKKEKNTEEKTEE